jgi:RimJ/RimL family protein N-acetyltransferase
MSKNKSFETERLVIRPTGIEDAALILELVNTPKWLEFIGDRNVKTMEESRAYIEEKMLPQLERLGYANYTVIKKSEGSKIGTCGLYDREGLDGIDIGFAFLPQFECQGYGYESALCIKNAAFEEFGIEELRAITSKKNVASQKLLEKLGFNCTGVTTLPGENEELLLYKH